MPRRVDLPDKSRSRLDGGWERIGDRPGDRSVLAGCLSGGRLFGPRLSVLDPLVLQVSSASRPARVKVHILEWRAFDRSAASRSSSETTGTRLLRLGSGPAVGRGSWLLTPVSPRVYLGPIPTLTCPPARLAGGTSSLGPGWSGVSDVLVDLTVPVGSGEDGVKDPSSSNTQDQPAETVSTDHCSPSVGESRSRTRGVCDPGRPPTSISLKRGSSRTKTRNNGSPVTVGPPSLVGPPHHPG